jgi:hypothetical protein
MEEGQIVKNNKKMHYRCLLMVHDEVCQKIEGGGGGV